MGATSQSRTPDTQLFRDIFNASPIGIAVENLEGQPLFVNPAFCSFLGFSEEELRNKHCVDFSPPEDAQTDWALFQQLRAGSIERYSSDPTPTSRPVENNASRVGSDLSPLLAIVEKEPSPSLRPQEEKSQHSVCPAIPLR